MKTVSRPGLSGPISYFKVLAGAGILLTLAAGSVVAGETTDATGSSGNTVPSPSPGGGTAPGAEVSKTEKPSSPATSAGPTVEAATSGGNSIEAASPSGSGSKTIRKKVEKIEVGDKVTVKIYPEDQYIKGGEMQVSSEGTITLPLLGRITVQGISILEAEQKITDLLSKDYLVNPVVVVEVADRIIEVEKKEVVKKSASILGQVQKPGPYDFPPEGKMTVLELISKAGGFTDVANVKKIKIIRKKGGKNSVIRANAESIIAGRDPDIELEPDDVVHVGESFF